MKPAAKTKSSLNERAMLAELVISHWEGVKKDKKVTAEVTNAKRAKGDAGGWTTRLVPPESLKDIGNVLSRARTTHFELTLPWSDAGARILSSEMFFDYQQTMDKLKDEFNTAVEAFLRQYPNIVAASRERLGSLFVSENYPTAEKLRAKFKWGVFITPIPDKKDFRVQLGDDAVAGIQATIDEQVASAVKNATTDMWARLHEVVAKIAERLGTPDAVFRDSLIDNARDLCGLLAKMNITNDPALEKMRTAVLGQLANQNPDELREDATKRAAVATTAEDMLKKIAVFSGM